jgi:hypothetical protein
VSGLTSSAYRLDVENLKLFVQFAEDRNVLCAPLAGRAYLLLRLQK